ncbi:MAG: hypothetical protein VB016_03930 [Methanomassiliicoccaceae archaeon]|nr:hypothetical protein [Methanomassiliicoccaceae archaeon]
MNSSAPSNHDIPEIEVRDQSTHSNGAALIYGSMISSTGASHAAIFRLAFFSLECSACLDIPKTWGGLPNLGWALSQQG